MSNLDDAFLKAYAKRPSNHETRSSASADSSSSPTHSSKPTSPTSAPSMQRESTNRFSPEDSNLKTSVVSSRAATRSATVRKSIEPVTMRSTHFSYPSDRRFRIDEVAPAVDSSADDTSIIESLAPTPKKQVTRKPLSEYLAEMREQIAGLENSTASEPSAEESHLTRGMIDELASSLSHHPAASSPVYTYPETAQSRHRLDQAEAAVKASVVDKMQLRKLANSSSLEAEEPSPLTKSSRGYAVSELDLAEPMGSAQASNLQQNAPVTNTPRPIVESQSVRDSWRHDDYSYRFDEAVQSKQSRTSEDREEPGRHAVEFAKPVVETKQRVMDEHRLGKARETDPWAQELSMATEAVVQSLADYNPNSESSNLYRQAKLSMAANKTRLEQQIAQAAHAVVTPFNAEWEVDEFQWPFTVLDLLEAQESSFEEIAAHLQNANKKGLKFIAVTSAERGVGKSTTSLCLAATMAHKGLNVAVVDGDIESPSLFNQMNLEIDMGWQGCLHQNTPLESVAIKSLAEKVTLFPLTDSIPSQDLPTHEVRINHILRRIGRSFDLVIIDTQRVCHKSANLIGTGQDAVLDAALVVVDCELSVKDRVDVTLQLLHDQQITSIGIVENFSEFRAAAKKAS